MISAAPMSVRCVPMSGMVISAGRKVPMRLPAVESANTRPATRPASCTPVAARRMANGVTMPSSTTGGANSARDAAKEPDDGAGRERVDARDGEVEEAAARRRGSRPPSAAAASTIAARSVRRRAAVGEAAAQPVAQRERGEDQADDVRPHDRRRAVVRRQQARGADLRRHGADAGEEDEAGGREGGGVVPGHGARVYRTRRCGLHGTREARAQRCAGMPTKAGKREVWWR